MSKQYILQKHIGDFVMLELRAGDFFAGCKIICICGKGGYGTVYLAENAAGEKNPDMILL